MKTLISNIVQAHSASIKKVAFVDTFSNLITRHEQNQEVIPTTSEKDTLRYVKVTLMLPLSNIRLFSN
jgi:hypothetical protein